MTAQVIRAKVLVAANPIITRLMSLWNSDETLYESRGLTPSRGINGYQESQPKYL